MGGGSRGGEEGFRGTERFEVLDVLGRGGMGVVYSVHDRELRRRMALKTIHHAEPSALLRLKTEFRALRELRHENLVSLGELVAEHGRWFFTMELIDGKNVVDAVRRDGTPPFDEALLREALIQLAKGLMALHATGRVHRDVKPSNVLVTPEGRTVLLDFGMVTRPEEVQTSDLLKSGSHPVGSAIYMAPEQAASRPATAAADWYSVGTLIYEALTGRRPFQGSSVQIMFAKQTQVPPAPSTLVEGVPPDLDALCLQLLSIDPHERPGGPAILEALGASAEATPGPAAAAMASTFVGRSAILARLEEALERSRRGEPVSVLVHGESGAGKSEVLRQLARRAVERDPKTIVLTGRCHQRERVPFKAFDSAIDDLSWVLRHLSKQEARRAAPPHADLLVETFPVLRSVPMMREASSRAERTVDPHTRRKHAFEALRVLLRRLSKSHPIVVLVEDIQWADGDSIRLLDELLGSPKAPPICFVASLRPSDDVVSDATAHFDVGARGPQTVGEALRSLPGPPEAIEVGRLDEAEALELAQVLLEGTGDRERAAIRIAREAGGHPLFIHELARHTRMVGVASEEGPVALEDVIRARVDALDSESRVILETLCTAARPMAQRVLASACEIDRVQVAAELGRLAAQQLVRIGVGGSDDAAEPYHARVRDAVLARVPRARRREHHAAFARALSERDPVDPELLAYHLRAAGRPGEAASYAARAARRAAGTMAFERAAELYAQAVAHWPQADPRGAAELRTQLGDVLANLGRGREAASVYLEAARGAALAADRQEYERRAAEQLLRTGHLNEGAEVASRILADVGVRLPRSTAGAMLSFLVHRAILTLRGHGYRRRDSSQIAPEQLVRVDVYRSLSQGLGLVETLRGAAMSSRYVLAALRAGEPVRVLNALLTEAVYLGATAGGRSRRLRRILELTTREAHVQGDRLSVSLLDIARGQAAFMAGRWAEACRLFDQVITAAGEYPGTGWEQTYARLVSGWSLFYLGELDELERRSREWLASASQRGDVLLQSGVAMGLYSAVWADRLGIDEARAHVDEQIEAWKDHDYTLQHYYALLARTQIDLYEGDGLAAAGRVEDEWRALRRAMLMQLASVRHEGLHLRARARLAAAAESRGGTRRRHLRGARLDAWRLTRKRLPWGRALASLVRASAHAAAGRDDRAVDGLRDAIEKLEAADMRMYASAARRRLGTLIGGDGGRELVDAAEQRMRSEGVVDLDATTRMLVPGFRE